MIAFKIYQSCPEEKRPVNIPLAWPWQEQICTEAQAEALQNQGFIIMTEVDYEAYKAQYQSEIDAWSLANTKVPFSVTPRQIRIALIMSGISLETIESMINALPEPDKSITRVTWEYSVEFQRSNPVLNAMTPMLGMTSSQVDDLFKLAATL
jgi:hypothetical protein